MALPRSSSRHYQQRQRLELLVRAGARRAWRGMGPDFDASWRGVGPQLVALVTSAQMLAAESGATYVGDVLKETNQDADPAADVRPQAFAGTASDGRPLGSLLYGGVTHAKQAVDAGESPTAALAQGQTFVDMAVWTTVADAARQATSVGITSRPTVTGWVRMINPPACSRCAILAGKWFGWNTGFDRHPRCDCTHIPSSEAMAGDFTTDPKAYFDSLSATEQERIFTKTGAQAVRDGADVSRVVNARRGMATTKTPSGRNIARRDARGMLTTTEGTTRRGRLPGQVRGARLMPESIYEIADGNRADAIRLLRRHGYLT